MTLPAVAFPIDVDAALQAVGAPRPTIYRGDEFVLTLGPITNPDGSTVNLSLFGPTLGSQLRISPDASDATNFATTRGSGNTLILTLTGNQTAALLADEDYSFDVEFSGGTISPITVFRGTLPVVGDITR